MPLVNLLRADGAAFMGWIKDAIKQPLLLALNG